MALVQEAVCTIVCALPDVSAFTAMTTPHTLVLGTAFDYSANQLRPFVQSLRRHYEGEALLLVNSSVQPEVLELLLRWDIGFRFFESARWMFAHIQFARFVRYYELLKESSVRYDRILLTDVSDVLFQAHPFAGAPEDPLLFFMEDSRATIGRCPSNSLWVRQIFGERALAELANEPISCAGTTMGTHDAILKYVHALIGHANPEKMMHLTQWRGHDQGIHNFLLHHGIFSNARRVENGDWVYTLAQVPRGEVVFTEDDIRTPSGRLCPIVHQWTYHPAVVDWTMRRWQ